MLKKDIPEIFTKPCFPSHLCACDFLLLQKLNFDNSLRLSKRIGKSSDTMAFKAKLSRETAECILRYVTAKIMACVICRISFSLAFYITDNSYTPVLID